VEDSRMVVGDTKMILVPGFTFTCGGDSVTKSDDCTEYVRIEFRAVAA
jgi:hypothetical protein